MDAVRAELPAVGDIVEGRFRIERLIGQGGMGVVFAVHHLVLGYTVALKLLSGEGFAAPESVTRFLNEARAASRIQGDHVARVLDVGMMRSGAPYIVLEYLEGEDFAALQRRGVSFDPTLTVDHTLQVLEALGQAHALGIVHRDLKPANLFLAKRPDGATVVKLLDFGIAKAVAPTADLDTVKTSTAALLGTRNYLSPEQLRTPRLADPRSDIWSVGVILYELLAGGPPFRGETLSELFIAILEQDPSLVSTLRPDVPEGLALVIQRCLARDVNRRFQNVGDLADALAPFGSVEGRQMAARVVHSQPSTDTASPAASGSSVGPALTANEASTLGVATTLASSDPAWQTGHVTIPGLSRTSPWPRALVAVAVVGLAFGGYAMLGSSFHAMPAETSAVVASQPAPPAPSAAPAPSITSTPPPLDVASTGAVASPPPSASPAKVPARAAKRTHAEECAVPYTFDGNGTKVFKRECF